MSSVFGRYSRPVVAFFVLLITCEYSYAGKEFLAGPHEQVSPNQLVVGLKPGGNIYQILNAIAPQAVAAAVGNRNAFVLHLPPGIQAAVSKLLAAHPAVNYVEPNRVLSTTVLPPNDTSLTQQWNLTTVQAVQAWSYLPDQYLTAASAGTNRVKVAVLDTGVDCTHPDFINAGGTSTDSSLGGQIDWADSIAIQTTTIASPACPWQDDYGHGTHVAGILAAATNNAAGVAALGFPLQLIIIKTSGSTGQATDVDVANGIYAAIAAGAQVISMSLGGSGYSQTMQSAMDAAWASNILVVAASGNTSDNSLVYPGAGNHVLGVGATDSSNTVGTFSTYGWTKIAAPGVGILSTLPTYSGPSICCTYGSLSGTSMATPQVAALGGLLYAANPGISVATVAQRIQQTAQSPNNGWNQYIGYGVINAAAALADVPAAFTQGGLIGQVVDVNGVPITGATVTAAGGGSYTTITDPKTNADSGLFRISLSPGTYPVTVSAVGQTTVNTQAVVLAGADTMMTIQMGVATGEFSGVVSFNGVAVAGAVVNAVSSGLIVGSSITNSSGNYALFVPPGSYTLTASAANYLNTTSGTKSLTANGSVTVNLALSALGTITGNVTDGNGLPVAMAHVDFTSSTFSGGTSTGSNGSYSTFGLPAGTYTVTASASGYANVSAGSVTVTNNTATLVNLKFATGVSLSSGLTGYWPFNEGSGSTAHDQSGNGRNAALTSTTWTSGVLFPSALGFNGSTSSASIPPISFAGPFSVSVWVNSAASQTAGAGLVQATSGPGWFLGTDSSGGKYKFYVDGGVGSTGTCGAARGCAQGGAIGTGWHMVTAIFDGVTAILYLDGAVIATDTFTGVTENSALVAGTNWSGAMQSLVLYGRALTSAEVAALFAEKNLTTLTLTKTADAASVSSGSAIGYTLAVQNIGATLATSEGLTDNLPGGTGINWSISPAYAGPGTCAIASGTLTCSFGNVASLGSTSVHVVSTTTNTSCGVYSNTASATANNASSVQASATTTVVCSQTITFGALANQPLGATPFSVSATATSGLTVAFNSQTTSSCTISGNTVTLVAMGTCTIQATQSGSAIYSAAPPVTQSFTVTEPIAKTTAASLGFANTIVGQSSAAQTFTLQNTGNSALTITSIAPAGVDAANYQYTSDTAHPCPISPATLGAGMSCTIDVTFTPVSQGTHNSAQIAITDNSGNLAGSVQSVSLIGTGIVLSSITISANNGTLAYGTGEAFTATGKYSDNSTATLSQVTWQSSTPSIASISSGGLANALLAGQTNITAAANGITSNSFQLTVVAGTATSIAVSAGSGQTATVGTAYAGALQAAVKDGGGNLVPNVSVTFTGPGSGAGGVFANGQTAYTATTNNSGIATASVFSANSTAGVFTVIAAVSGIANPASFSLTNLKPPALTVTEQPTGTFVQGQTGSYFVTVTNAANAGPTSGTITVTESAPTGLTLISLSGGASWSCSVATASCSSNVVLNPGATSSITVTMAIAFTAPASVSNGISVSGGASQSSSALDSTAVLSACAVTLHSGVSMSDVQQIINEALGVAKAANDLSGDGIVNGVDVQIVTNAALGGSCKAS